MWTNYYIRQNNCKTCWRNNELHIWKSSWGWDFTFQYNWGEYYKNYEQFKEFIKNKEIYNEYGEKQDYNEFIEFIELKLKNEWTRHCNDEHWKYIWKYYFLDCDFS